MKNSKIIEFKNNKVASQFKEKWLENIHFENNLLENLENIRAMKEISRIINGVKYTQKDLWAAYNEEGKFLS